MEIVRWDIYLVEDLNGRIVLESKQKHGKSSGKS